MGGFGSGNQFPRLYRKTTVEECYTFDINTICRTDELYAGRTGSFAWSNSVTGERLGSIGYSLGYDADDDLVLWLKYHFGDDTGPVKLPIRLQTTRPHLGGIRWWMICPLIKAGTPCNRRVSKLQLRYQYFGCRHCHELTYQSSQEAHKSERIRKMMCRVLEMSLEHRRSSDDCH